MSLAALTLTLGEYTGGFTERFLNPPVDSSGQQCAGPPEAGPTGHSEIAPASPPSAPGVSPHPLDRSLPARTSSEACRRASIHPWTSIWSSAKGETAAEAPTRGGGRAVVCRAHV
ncbi:hypothetical protein EDB80DRAFT_676520 [Ilyonectria destructans]|nr:hypothetical protein EDB80DRAFT_676520 [Ilyonectria destructans]